MLGKWKNIFFTLYAVLEHCWELEGNKILVMLFFIILQFNGILIPREEVGGLFNPLRRELTWNVRNPHSIDASKQTLTFGKSGEYKKKIK